MASKVRDGTQVEPKIERPFALEFSFDGGAVVQKFRLPIFVLIMLCLQIVNAQVSSDWQKRYGPPTAERYLIRDEAIMAVFYSEDGRTCKADVQLTKPQPFKRFDAVLNEIIPLTERGKEIRSIGLTSGLNGIASMDYEQVHISVNSSGEGTAKGATTGNVVSAIISWKGVPCKLAEQKIPSGNG